MRETLGCVTQQRLTIRERSRLTLSTPYTVALNDMDPVPLRGERPLHLTVGQNIRLVETDDPGDPRGPIKVSTVRYYYVLETEADEEILSFHWTSGVASENDSESVAFPHLHIGPALIGTQPAIRPKNLRKAHIPTGRVSLEAVIRLAIEEFGVTPLHPGWQEILTRTEAAFTRWKTS